VTVDAHEVAIAVRDNGFGLDALQRQHLFEPYNRLGRQRAAAPGAGLGLVITRQLVEAMNGQLRVESEPGLGSCFTVVLPAALGPPRNPLTNPPTSDVASSDRNDPHE
jgi:signal transduction histidine kinase